jgi:hypothetical protein
MKALLLFGILFGLIYVNRVDAQTIIPILDDALHDTRDVSFGPILVPAGVTQAVMVIEPFRQANGKLAPNAILQPTEGMTITTNLSLNGGIPTAQSQPLLIVNFTHVIQPATYSMPLPEPSSGVRVISGTVSIHGTWRGPISLELD